jgi:hypothetical protein
MNSKEIIDNIMEIYRRFNVPPNLPSHLFRAAAVGDMIADHWKGPKLSREDLRAYLLLHDFGNIVKYDFSHKELLTPEMQENIDYWKTAQQEARQKYGSDDHEATTAMARELGVPERVMALLEQDDFRNLEAVAAGNDWEQKIGKYSDYRGGPLRVVLLADRIADLRKRYAGKIIITHDPNLEKINNAMILIEKQVISNTTLKPEDINEQSIKKYLDKY